MSPPINNIDADLMRALVSEYLDVLLDGTGQKAEVREIRISQRLHLNDKRYHHLLKLYYSTPQGADCKYIWLKFRPSLKRAFELHQYAYEGMSHSKGFIPRPYFLYEAPAHQHDFIAMEYVTGIPLRVLLARALGTRRSRTLVSTFRELGYRMRAFHDMSPLLPGCTLDKAFASARRHVHSCSVLDEAAKNSILRHLATTSEGMDLTSPLPSIHCHNDWSMRNIICRPDGNTTLIDLDAMQLPPVNRWYEVIHFLTNLEGQVKFAPLLSLNDLSMLAQTFLAGYLANPSRILPAVELEKLLYVLKVRYTFGGANRRPLTERVGGPLRRRYLDRLYAALSKGQSGLLSLEEAYPAVSGEINIL
ncbi:MAG: hypothetical protein O6944_00950 [Gammaproteobacteria bacterium]|nr:hypothetical protein [Gammaproteobacteria bacterium]